MIRHIWKADTIYFKNPVDLGQFEKLNMAPKMATQRLKMSISMKTNVSDRF